MSEPRQARHARLGIKKDALKPAMDHSNGTPAVGNNQRQLKKGKSRGRKPHLPQGRDTAELIIPPSTLAPWDPARRQQVRWSTLFVARSRGTGSMLPQLAPRLMVTDPGSPNWGQSVGTVSQ